MIEGLHHLRRSRPMVVVSDDDPTSTFENITLDATGSFGPDGGELLCSSQ